MADISVGVVLDDSQYTSKLADIQKKTQDFTTKTDTGLKSNTDSMKKFGDAAEVVRTKMQTLGTAIVGVGLIDFISKSLEASEQMVNFAGAAGVSTQAMIELSRASLDVGKTTEDTGNMLLKLEDSAQAAADGNVKAALAFTRIGITLNDLKTKNPEQLFRQITQSLAGIEDPGLRVATAMALMGKNAKSVNWDELATSQLKFAGTGKEAASAMEDAKKVMDDLKQKSAEVQQQFILLAKPILEWIDPFIKGTGGARDVAIGLAVAMGLFAGAGVITAINSIVTGVISLAGAFGLTSKATTTETAALAANNAATLTSAESKLALASAGLAAKVASLENSIALATEAGAMEVAEKLTWRLGVAKAALAESTSALEVVTGLEAGVIATAAKAEVGATTATVGLAGSMAGLRAAIVSTVGPFNAVIAAGVSLYAVYQSLWGTNGVLSKTGNKSGSNFISDMFGITNSTATDAAAATKKFVDDFNKAMADAKAKQNSSGKGGTISGGTGDTAAAQQLTSMKAQYELMLLTNQRATERLKLETNLVGASDDVRAAQLAGFDEQTAKLKEVQRIQTEINRIRAEPKTNFTDQGGRLAILEKEKASVIAQAAAMEGLKGKLIAAQDVEKVNAYIQDQGVVALTKLKDMNEQLTDSYLTEDQKRIISINKEVDTAVQGALKIRQAQLGATPIGSAETQSITQRIKTQYEPVTNAATGYSTQLDAQRQSQSMDEERLKVAKNIQDIQLQTAQLTMNADQIAISNIQKEANADIEAELKKRTAESGLVQAESERATITEKINALYAPQIQAMMHLTDASRSFTTGWNKAWADFANDATNESKRAQETFNTLEQSFESMFDQMVTNGKVNWQSLLQNMLVQLMNSDLKRVFADLTAGTTGGSSKILGGIGKLFSGAFASGGNIPAGGYGIVGESGPEYVNGPATVTPTSSSSTEVHYHINAVDAKSFQSLLAQDPSFLYAVSLKGQRMLPGA